MAWIRDIGLQNRERPVPGFFDLVDRGVENLRPVEDGQIIRAGKGLTLEVIHSPGHSPGSVNLYFREDGILFTADSIPLVNDIPNYADYHQLMRSLRAIKSRDDVSLLVTSWTPPLSERTERERLITEGEAYMSRIDKPSGRPMPGKRIRLLPPVKQL